MADFDDEPTPTADQRETARDILSDLTDGDYPLWWWDNLAQLLATREAAARSDDRRKVVEECVRVIKENMDSAFDAVVLIDTLRKEII